MPLLVLLLAASLQGSAAYSTDYIGELSYAAAAGQRVPTAQTDRQRQSNASLFVDTTQTETWPLPNSMQAAYTSC